jgi:uncharacterized membrane protein YozB (DUF420 family)
MSLCLDLTKVWFHQLWLAGIISLQIGFLDQLRIDKRIISIIQETVKLQSPHFPSPLQRFPESSRVYHKKPDKREYNGRNTLENLVPSLSIVRMGGLSQFNGRIFSRSNGAMTDFLSRPGFLGTNASFLADVTLILILLSALSFTVGWQLACHKHYEAHRWVQTVNVGFNAIVVFVGMVNSFVTHILPGIPAKLLEGDYGVTTLHALVGLTSLLLGIFVVLRANKLVPKALRFKNYKRFMRTAYALYMLATLLGVIVYLEVYVFRI